VQCVVNRIKIPKIAYSPWDFVIPPEEDHATAIDNIYKKFGKDRACCSGDILVDRQTDTQTCSSQYFSIAPAGKVTSNRIGTRSSLTDKVASKCA